MISRILCLTALCVAVALAIDDACSQWPTCTVCLNHPFCGWCSQDVQYQDGTTGKQCAGFAPNNKSEPFTCSGIYSTEQCVVGYVCDNVTFTCKQAEPGDGVPLPQCMSQCQNTGKVYACNKTTSQCYVTDPGKGTSLQLCMEECSNTQHPTNNPTSSPGPTSSQGPTASPTPSPTPSLTYVCNETTYTCETSTPGHGTSKAVCDAQCIKPTPHNNTPSILLGLWRGIQTNTGYQSGEYSILFNTSTATFVLPGNKIVIEANTQSYGTNQVWLLITSPSSMAGHTLKGVYNPAPNGPETRWMELAFGGLDADAPQDFVSALSNSKDNALWLSQCLTPTCVFHLSNQNFGLKAKTPNSTDYCHAYGDNCTFCISHKYCGWCSQNVQYQDGTTGNQCAGFNPDTSKQPFTCSGVYSTEMCAVGYTCNATSGQCVMAPPGDGVPLAQCQQQCVAPVQGYRCDNATKQCVPDKTGGDKNLCASYCNVTPHGNTPSFLIGKWRGLEIRNGYTVGEYDMLFNSTALTMTGNGVFMFTANVQQQGPMMTLTITSGTNTGKTILVLYQSVSDSSFNMGTFAFGQPSGLIPASFDESMRTTGETEYVMAKCLDGSPCHFTA